MSFLELLCLMLSFQHIYLDIVHLQLRDLAVQNQGATVSIERESNYVELIEDDSFDETWSSVNLVFAESASHADFLNLLYN